MADADPFLDEAERRGLLTAAQAADCRRLLAAMQEVHVELSIDEIAARKGFVTESQGAELRRALARLRVGRYEVIERLGEGAAGVVWKARDTKLDRIVALKVLSQKAQVAPAFRERFLREARIAVTLNDTHIVRGLDYGEADGYQYFAMEFVDGENAEVRLARLGRIPEKEAVAMALDVVSALQYVHRFLIVHRDIKPSNLLVTSSGHAKLGDLGLAKPMLGESELLAGDGSTAGTPYYMSPEQIKEPEKIDWRSDVYSLGATLYHLLTGVPVFRSDGQASVTQKHLREKPRNPREHVLELSDGVASVVLRMLQKAPADRYASLDELQGDLEAVLAGRQPQHTAPPVPPDEATAERHARMAIARRITEKNLPREQFPWITVAMFVIVATAVAAVGMSLNRRGANADTDAAKPAARDAPPARTPLVEPVTETPKDPLPAPPGPDPVREFQSAEALQDLINSQRALLDAGRFDKPLADLAAFAADHAGTAAAKKAGDEAARIGRIVRGRFDELVANAEKAAQRHRFDEARAFVEKASKVDARWAEDEARVAAKRIEGAEIRHESERKAQAPAFADLYGAALLTAGGEGVDAARALVGSRERSVPAYGDDVSQLQEDLALLARDGVDPDTIDATTARGALALLLARLARGEVGEAERTIESVRAAGGDVEAARARLAHVKGVLEQQARAILAGAERELAANQPGAARRDAEAALKLYPEFVPATLLLARIRVSLNELDEAVALFHAVLARRDAPAEAHYWFGVALSRRKEDLARAEIEITRFLDVAGRDDPLRAEAEAARRTVHEQRVEGDVKRWRDVAKSLTGKGKRDLEEGAWGRVAELRPDDAEALLALGRIYVEKKQTNPAYVALSRVAKVTATDAQRKRAADLLAQIRGSGLPSEDGQGSASDARRYFDGENWDKAVQLCQAALLVSPHLSETRILLVRAYLARFREKGAAEDARAALDAASALTALFPEEAVPLALRADAQLLVGDPKHRAVEDANRAATLDPKDPLVQAALGRAMLSVGDAARALTAFGAANAAEPSPDAMLGIARCHVLRGDLDEARAALERLKGAFRIPAGLRDDYDELMKEIAGGK